MFKFISKVLNYYEKVFLNIMDLTIYHDFGLPPNIFATDGGDKSGLESSCNPLARLLHYFDPSNLHMILIINFEQKMPSHKVQEFVK